jgi:pimeloyl-ACP methyl ester carboxylesterase
MDGVCSYYTARIFLASTGNPPCAACSNRASEWWCPIRSASANPASRKPTSSAFRHWPTRALLEQLGIERAAVVGHSMGGMLAVRFALLYPALTEKLVLVAPLGLEDWKRAVPARSVNEWYAEELKATPDSIREYQKQAYYAGNWRPEYERQIEFAAGMTQHPDYPKVAWCSALTYDMIFNQPVVYELGDLKPPTLLIIGMRDRTAIGRGWASKELAAKLGNYRELGKQAAAAIPGAQLVELESVGHLPQVEAFEAYAKALLAFLS